MKMFIVFNLHESYGDPAVNFHGVFHTRQEAEKAINHKIRYRATDENIIPLIDYDIEEIEVKSGSDYQDIEYR